MEIYININGVLRNIIQKFEYHYIDYFLESDEEDNDFIELDDDGEVIKETTTLVKTKFEYGLKGDVKNDNLFNHYKFQSIEEFENFIYLEYPVEIFGHAGISYPSVITDLNKFIHDNKEHNITIVGIDELGRAKPSTLFFLSRNGCLADNVKFIKSENVMDAWQDCDVWVTDSLDVLECRPKDKMGIKFKTNFNEHFTNPIEIDKLTEIEKLL